MVYLSFVRGSTVVEEFRYFQNPQALIVACIRGRVSLILLYFYLSSRFIHVCCSAHVNSSQNIDRYIFMQEIRQSFRKEFSGEDPRYFRYPTNFTIHPNGLYERLWKIKRPDADSDEEYLLPWICASPCIYPRVYVPGSISKNMELGWSVQGLVCGYACRRWNALDPAV